MAAGQGFKTFTTGEVLTAGDVNGYLMQGINVFASEAARDAAITAPAEGQFAFTKDNNSLWYYTGSAWAASGATGDIEGVTAGVGISGGGTSGTVTITNSMATAIDAKGDLVPGTGADTFARLAVGANGTVLTADSAEATGLKWGTVSSGAVVQVKSAVYSTSTSNSTTTYADTGLSLSITPTSASNKVLVIIQQMQMNDNTAPAYETAAYLRIMRDSTAIFNDTNFVWYHKQGDESGYNREYTTLVYLDSPATTSSITYKTQQRVYVTTVTAQPFSNPSTITLLEVTP
jgi:hypothetical protein